MPENFAVPKLGGGAFFGEPCRSVVTASFDFCELEATVPERQVPRHTHQSPHFILITQGTYVTEARNHPGLCSPGTFIFNPAGITHQDRFRSPQGRFVSITVGSATSHFLDAATTAPLIIAGDGIQGTAATSKLGKLIVREVQGGLDSTGLVLEELGLEVTAILSGIEERAVSKTPPTWLMLAKELIEDCFSSDLRIPDLATATGVHPVYLARAYRRYFGHSPGEHLRRCRLLRVQALLAKSKMPLVQIALQCGYSDQSQMTRAFTAVFGMPPARYRALGGDDAGFKTTRLSN